MNRLPLCLAVVMSGLVATIAQAQDHIDILAYDDNGSIGIGFFDFDTQQTVTGYPLFTETFVNFFPGLYATGAPGFYNTSEQPLLPSTDLAFDALGITHPDPQVEANLLYWDGQGPVDFAAPTDGSTLQFRLSAATNISVDGSANDVPGFVLEGTSPSGLIHKHIDFGLFGGGGADPADGLYLAAIQLNMSGLTSSDPVYMLFNADYQRDIQNNIVFIGDTPQVDPASEGLAVGWIEQNLLGGAIDGDLDGDGFVGIDDLNLVLGNWNQNVPPGNPLADPSGDGFVGIDDLNTVLGNWNAGTPPAATSVPEPASLGVLLGLGIGLRWRGRVI